MKTFLGLVSLLTVMTASVGAAAQDEGNPLVGGQLYRSYCLVCHGADGKTRGPVATKLKLNPTDLSLARYQEKTAHDLSSVIGGYWKQDREGMPNWRLVLSPTELLDISAYVVTLTLNDATFQGDTRRGRVVYKNACVSCHGKFGQGDGVLAGLFDMPTVDLVSSAVSKSANGKAMISIIREGKGGFMPSWKNELSDSEISDVAAYVRMLAK